MVCASSVSGQEVHFALFHKGDMGNAWEVMRPVVKGKPESVPVWEQVALPHCYNAYDAVDATVPYYQGAAWYKMTVKVDEAMSRDHRLIMHFDGAGQRTKVYVYTQLVGEHVGGYDEWECDITDAALRVMADKEVVERFGGEVPVAVRVDNSRDVEMIPSDMSDFNLYGGIYRPVRIEWVKNDAIRHFTVSTQLSGDRREGKVVVTLPEHEAHKDVELTLLDKDGRTIGRAMTNGGQGVITVKKPLCWSPDSPVRYRLTVGNEERMVGFRSFSFEKDGPFMLNGKRLLLRGTHRHEDHAGVGAAMLTDDIRKELQQIKDMGANFIRLGHYQQGREVLNLCDSLGLLVWEEIPWCRGGLGGEAYRKQAMDMLENMIRQHSHHPSIILWGLGNENDWPGDFPEFSKEDIHAFMAQLHDRAHSLDPTRLTTIRRCDFCKDVVDVYSPSIWAGWYSRKFTDYYEMEKAGHDLVPRFLHAEWGGDSHAGRHSEISTEEHMTTVAGDKTGDWSESYICRLFDWHLKEQERMPWLTGSAFWTFKDFSTPLRPENPIPYVNQKGVVQRDGTPKEAFYVVQSYWSQKPMLHIYGHDWPVRWGREGEEKEVLVYSNCEKVELLVNGESKGIRHRNSADFPAAGLHWKVCLAKGENIIIALARQKDGTVLSDTVTTMYETRQWTAPAKIKASVEKDKTSGAFLVKCQIEDASGVPCLDDKSVVEFGCSMPGIEYGRMGTQKGSRRIEAANGRAQILMPAEAAGSAVTIKACGMTQTVMLVDAQPAAQTLTLEFENTTGEQRQELAEIDAKSIYDGLGLKYGAPVVVTNSAGIEQQSQLTHDGKLLVDVSVMPHGKTIYNITKGLPQKGIQWTAGSLYKQRLDDIAWENDRGAYRIYGPAFREAGNIGYGIDVWSKNTLDLILDERFSNELDKKAHQRYLREHGYKDVADKMGRDNSFHLDHGTGNDVYAVGPTLGCGATALMTDGGKGDAVFSECWEDYEILDNGPLRFTLKMRMSPYRDGEGRVIATEQRIISLDKGSNLNRIEVWYDNEEPLTVCAGFPLHSPNEDTVVMGNGFAHYADPTDRPEANTCLLYVGCTFPYDSDVVMAKRTIGGEKGLPHALGIKRLMPGQHFVYYAGAAWSKHDVRSQKEWDIRLKSAIEAANAPLTIKIVNK